VPLACAALYRKLESDYDSIRSASQKEKVVTTVPGHTHEAKENNSVRRR
jgi:hypothetical protein